MTNTPYDGSHKPFTIGLKPLDPSEWLVADAHFDHYIEEKRRLYLDEFENVLVAEAGTQDAQQELFELILSDPSLPRKWEPRPTVLEVVESLGPRFYGDDGQRVGVIAAAGLLVQEDLVLMRKSPEGWRLVAASLCFPSSWNLREKFGKPLHAVHGPVPGFNEGTRNATLIERMFDNLWPEKPVMRWNWSLYGDDRLYHPAAEGSVKRRFGDGPIAEHVFLRLERQTLRKLPMSGDIVFTIRIHIDPLTVLNAHPDGPNLSKAIAAQLNALSPEELVYKGLATERENLLARLERIGLTT
jgi:dimethylamine monooxygenase subunit A